MRSVTLVSFSSRPRWLWVALTAWVPTRDRCGVLVPVTLGVATRVRVSYPFP